MLKTSIFNKKTKSKIKSLQLGQVTRTKNKELIPSAQPLSETDLHVQYPEMKLFTDVKRGPLPLYSVQVLSFSTCLDKPAWTMFETFIFPNNYFNLK